MNGRFNRLALGLAMLVGLASSAFADDPIADTVRQWGLLGPWSLDCRLPPDHTNGALLAYEIGPDGGVVYHRDFGDVSDESEVLAAHVSDDGLLNLEVFFPAIKQKREYGLMMLSDGSLRSIYSRDDKGEYSIKDGKFVATRKPTPTQHRCD